MASSAVSSVIFHPATRVEETRQGNTIYRGDASSFHEWEFRAKLKVAGKTDHALTEAVSKIVDGLRDDAFTVAT